MKIGWPIACNNFPTGHSHATLASPSSSNTPKHQNPGMAVPAHSAKTKRTYIPPPPDIKIDWHRLKSGAGENVESSYGFKAGERGSLGKRTAISTHGELNPPSSEATQRAAVAEAMKRRRECAFSLPVEKRTCETSHCNPNMRITVLFVWLGCGWGLSAQARLMTKSTRFTARLPALLASNQFVITSLNYFLLPPFTDRQVK